MSRLIKYNNNKNALLNNIYKLNNNINVKTSRFIINNNSNNNNYIIENNNNNNNNNNNFRNFCTLTSTKQSDSKPNLFGTISNFFDKVKKKSFIIDNYFQDGLEQPQPYIYSHIEIPLSVLQKQNIEPLQILDPLNSLNKKKSNEIFKIVENDLSKMTDNIINTITTGVSATSSYSPAPSKRTNPILTSISKYYFELKGKRIRPTIVLLLSQALQSLSVINNNSNINNNNINNNININNNNNVTKEEILENKNKQLKLAEVVEMIHTASLVHDDVIDEASTRRDVLSINHSYSNKLAILCGDFLLARASVILATIRNSDVTECMSIALAELVEGEFMQAKSNGVSSFDHYLKKTYLKTGSLITNSCRSAAILSGCDENIVNISTEFGKNLGLAFQIIDDLLDYTGTAENMGKAVSVDLNLGLATAPVLFATQEFPQLEDLIKRKFSEDGDVEEAKRLVAQSQGIEKTRNLAIEYVNLAIQSLLKLPQSEARDLLITLSHTVVTRTN